VPANARDTVTNFSAAHGVKNTITKGNAFAFGTLVTAQDAGAFVLGDRSYDPFVEAQINAARANAASRSWGENTMTMRFGGGYRFYVGKQNAPRTYDLVELVPGGGGWRFESDVRKKENFKPVQSEAILANISRFKLTTWNYVGHDPQRNRHYGPMAQDFFAAFGKDSLGTIGTDTTIASTDFDGLNFTAIHALVKRTEEMREKDRQLEQKTRELEALMTQLKAQQAANEQLRSQLAGQQAELSAQQARSDKLETDLEAIKRHLGIAGEKETGDGRKADRKDRDLQD
jgi:hypothetical protein